jgi:hypothetical protein
MFKPSLSTIIAENIKYFFYALLAYLLIKEKSIYIDFVVLPVW